MKLPRGKGIWIWQIWRLEGSTVDQVNYDGIVDALVAAGVSHVYTKIADGTYPYNVKWSNYPYWSGEILEDFNLRLVSKLRDVGIDAYGWHYVRGYRPLDEARVAIERVKALNLDGYSIDAEWEYRNLDKADEARTFMAELHEGIPDVAVSLASYRYPDIHWELPWGAFLAGCDYVAQQLYWEQAHNPGWQLRRSLDQYRSLMQRLGISELPQHPIGSGYGRGDWIATPGDITEFLQVSRDEGRQSASLWSFDWMRARGLSLWEAFSNFTWEIQEPGAGVPFMNLPPEERWEIVRDHLIAEGVLSEEGNLPDGD